MCWLGASVGRRFLPEHCYPGIRRGGGQLADWPSWAHPNLVPITGVQVVVLGTVGKWAGCLCSCCPLALVFQCFSSEALKALTITELLWHLWVSTTPVPQSSTSCKKHDVSEVLIYHILRGDFDSWFQVSFFLPRPRPLCCKKALLRIAFSGLFPLQELSSWLTYLLGVLWSLGERLIL